MRGQPVGLIGMAGAPTFARATRLGSTRLDSAVPERYYNESRPHSSAVESRAKLFAIAKAGPFRGRRVVIFAGSAPD